MEEESAAPAEQEAVSSEEEAVVAEEKAATPVDSEEAAETGAAGD